MCGKMTEAGVADETLVGFGVTATVLLYGMRHLLIVDRKVSNSVACSIISLVHHVVVSVACFSANVSFLKVLNDGITFQTDSCDPIRYATNPLAYVGTFSVAYLLLDSIFDLIPHWNNNKLMIFHHLNGIVLISISINTQYGQYMVYTAHMMEVSSVFLNAKLLLREFKAPDAMKDLNDKAFAISFLVIRNYTSWACLFLVYSLYRNGCFQTISFMDVLIVYTSIFFVIINTFWSYGIIGKVYMTLRGSPKVLHKVSLKDSIDTSETDHLLDNSK